MSYNPKLLGVALLSLLILATCVFGAAIASENPTITKSPSHEGLDGNTYHLTLITGDKLTVVRDEQGRLSIAVDGQKKQDFRVLRTSRGTYVFPKGVDLKKMDTELFNIDYLIDEGYCNMSYLPVLIDYKKDGIMGISEMTPVKELERGGQMSIVRTYASVPTFSARLSVDSVKESGEALEKSPQIERIWLDKKVHASLYDSVPIIDAPRVWQQGYNGSGVEIAILDTGIDDKHPDLDDLDDNASTNDPKVVRAVNFTNDNTTNDLYGHGTYCAGIAAGTGYGETLLHNASMSTYAKLASHKGEMAASQSLMSVGTPDAYEPDNNYTQASWISTNGTSQHHNFHVAGDHDWVKFNATANTTYKIETSGLGPDCDTYLYLYSTDGTTEMVHNDDNGYSRASLIIWKFGAAGTYYVMVRDYSTSACGNDTYYNLSVSEYVPPAEFTDVYSDHGEDTNLDGMYDFLVVDVGVNVRETGYYGVSASLYESGTDHYVDYAESYAHLERGVQTVQMKFRGLRLYAKGYNGTYDVRELSLYSEPNDERVSYRENAYTTQSYNYTQFQQYRRYVGVAPAAKLWNVKVLNQSGVGYDSWVIAGIEYAAYGPDGTANTGDEADVISMSLGGMPTYGGDPLSQAVSNAVSHGVVVAVAAGNSGPWYYTIESPGTAGEAITVGASTKNDRLAWFSSRGPTLELGVKPDVLAPGDYIVSARADGTSVGHPINEYYTQASGTSAATPHVAGACALLLQARPAESPAQLKDRLVSTARDISSASETLSVYEQGGGRINVSKALSTPILVDPSVVSFGFMNSTSSRVITFHNMDTTAHTLNLSVKTMNALTHTQVSCASLNRTSLTIPAGQSGAVLLTINPTSLNKSLYSGVLTANGSDEVHAVFGFSKLNRLVVSKINMSGDAAAGEIVAVVAESIPDGFEHEYDAITDENGRAVFYLPDGTYQVMSGWGSDPNVSIYTTKDNVSLTDAMNITLDERDAKCVSFNPNKAGQIMSEKYDELDYNGKNVSVGFSALYAYPNDTRTYITPTTTFKSVFTYTYYPRAYYNETNPWLVNAPEWHKLVYNLSSVVSNTTFTANYTELVRRTTQYRVALVPEHADVAMFAFHPDMWGAFAHTYTMDAPLQRDDWLSPVPIDYAGEYVQNVSSGQPSWYYEYEGRNYSVGERTTFGIGEHPLTSGMDVNIKDRQLIIEGAISQDAYGSRFGNLSSYYDSGNITVVKNGTTVIDHSRIGDGLWLGVGFAGETVFNIIIEGRASRVLSTHTKTELNLTANASRDYKPPHITMRVLGSSLNNTVPAGDVGVIVYAKDESMPNTSLEYSLDNGTTWMPAVPLGTEIETAPTYTKLKSSFSLGRIVDGYVSLRARASDVSGNSITQTTIAGFYVAGGVPNATMAIECAARAFKPNDNFTVCVNASSIKPVFSGQYTIMFNPSVFEVISQAKGSFLTSDGNNSTVLISRYNNTNGTAEYGEFRTGTTAGITGKGTLATIRFHVKSDAPLGSYALVFRPNETLLGDVNASSMDVALKNLVLTITNNLPPVARATVKHAINNAGASTYLNGSASYDPDGTIRSWTWDFGDGATGSWAQVSHVYTSYRWNGTAYEPFMVRLTVMDNASATNTATIPVSVYMAADANGDGMANILDAALVGLHWQAHYGSAEYSDGADLNNDDVVNILDAAIVGLNWNARA